ncbi:MULTISPECIES: NAD(P)/FAD-dependent oxidoreductase [Rhodobacterales]|uniref:Ferredoxin reductase n=2 Tax=Rhodobacterales TaxID=204455 RepID=K2ICB0_9RHOB|nr:MULTISPECIES: FAD-dependent oxidoreductase [Rhodobacterales]EKE67556.1 ferredoxin reductase [Celeribacter baekdonensis B30]TMV89839.1 pyridine nucleotide-disulfide oxidoreductase [Thioclava sp. BHET1]SPF82013.1 Rhodocoxin reductase [Pseudoprimorskyibacter insulae]
MEKQILIVGAGQAACSLAGKYRQLDSDAVITIVGDEEYLPYQRPPLSKKFVTGEMSVESLFLRPNAWYERNNISLISGRRVVHIDRNSKQIQLDDRRILHYDMLALTTGTRPRVLPSEIGGDLKGVYLVRGIDDAKALATEMTVGRRALVIGGGYIGLEAAAAFRSQGLQVRVVEMADRILQRVSCAETSNYFRKLHHENGVQIYEGLGVERLIGDNGRVVAAEFSDGSTMEVDFVIVGVGVVANDELACEADLEVDQGILVNAFGQTNDKDIFAAGDCTRFKYLGHMIRLESVQNAVDQAESVAANMAGVETAYFPFPWFWSDQFDVKLQIAGLNQGYTDTVVRKGAKPRSMSVWYFSNGRLISVDAINDPRIFMIAKKMLSSNRLASIEQLRDHDFDPKSILVS